MKQLLLLCLALISWSLLSGQTNFIEDFDLNLGSLNNQNQWQGNTNFLVVSDAIMLAGYPQSNSEGKALRVQSSGGNISRGNLLAATFSAGAAYLSFLVRIDDQNELPGFPAFQLGLEKATFTNTFAGIGFYENPLTSAIEASLTTQSSGDEVVTNGGGFTVGTVYHVVLKYEFLPAANDALKVYISPAFMPFEPASPLLQTTVSGTGLPDEIGRILISAPPGSSSMMTVDGIQFGNAWNGNFDPGLLPVELVDFRGTMQQERAKLSWRTLSETNNELFQIQRSSDGRSFATIGEVPGFGNSHQPHSYQFEDQKPPPGFNYYRLIQRDYAGTTSQSEVIVLENKKNTVAVSLYPNPTTDFVNVTFFETFTSSLNFRILRSDGRVMPLSVISNERQYTIDVRGWNAGVYVLELSDDTGFYQAHQIIVR